MSAFDDLDHDTLQEIEVALNAGQSVYSLATDLKARGIASGRTHEALRKKLERYRRDVVQPRQVKRIRAAASRSPRHVGSRASTLERLRALSDQSEAEAWNTADARDRGEATNKDTRAALDHARDTLMCLHRMERELGVVDTPRRPNTHTSTSNANDNDVFDAEAQEAALCAEFGITPPSRPIPERQDFNPAELEAGLDEMRALEAELHTSHTSSGTATCRG